VKNNKIKAVEQRCRKLDEQLHDIRQEFRESISDQQ
jgi:hypothetical protein